MGIDTAFEASVAGGIRAGFPLEHDRAAAREDQPGPCKEQAALTEGDAAVVLADEPSSLRDEQEASGWTVRDGGGDLRRHVAREIGPETADERGLNHRPRLQDVGARGRGYPRQRRTTVMVRVRRSRFEQTVSDEFRMLHRELTAYFSEMVDHLIADAMNSDGDDENLEQRHLPG
jgi:hypothetical protein